MCSLEHTIIIIVMAYDMDCFGRLMAVGPKCAQLLAPVGTRANLLIFVIAG